MTIENEEDLARLKAVGSVVARTLQAMGAALEGGMTSAELDAFGRKMLEVEGCVSAPESSYGFPGATCISIFPAIAHGIPGEQRFQPGDLVNIDVSASRAGIFADTGGSFIVPGKSRPHLETLCRDGRRALWEGIRAVKAGRKLNEIGRAVQTFADRNGYTIIRNLASHGTGTALHEDPKEIATWDEPSERRRITNGLVFTIEPFLSLGSEWAMDGDDDWTLMAMGGQPTVQYEHTLVATPRGAVVITQPN